MALKIPPPLWFAACALLMWALATMPVKAGVPSSLWLAALCLVLAMAFIIPALYSFWRAHTTANPLHPEQTRYLVRHGIYRVSRNPMYLGMAWLLAAWAAWLGHILAWPGVALFILVITRWQIVPEEQVLQGKFGDTYRDYCRRTRRWL